jgi:hypothetical protein
VTSNYELINLHAGQPDGVPDHEHFAAQGWEDFFVVGYTDGPLTIHTWRRPTDAGGWQYVVQVTDVLYGSEFIRVPGLVELMDLLARWAPAVQAAAICDLLHDLGGAGLNPEGTVETVAARAKYGVIATLPRLQVELRDRQEEQARAREARRRARDEGGRRTGE